MKRQSWNTFNEAVECRHLLLLTKYAHMKQTLFLLLILLTCHTVALHAQDTGFVKVVDAINVKLEKWAEGGSSVSITAKTNGDISIVNKRNQSLSFNLFDLVITDDNNKKNNSGIEAVPCDKRAHAPLAWIKFFTSQRQVAFIRLDCNTPLSELENLYNLFLHLKSLCKESS